MARFGVAGSVGVSVGFSAGLSVTRAPASGGLQ